MPRYEGLVSCCVDLDHSAINTTGNAIETRRWVKDRGFSSLIVVTSAYHMPRTMAELAKQMPDIALVPFPVVTEKLRNEPWWASGPTAQADPVRIRQVRRRAAAHEHRARARAERQARAGARQREEAEAPC